MAETKRKGADGAIDRRKQILRAAIHVFAEKGFHRTRVSDIAKKAGVAYGLVYHYFDSKDEILNSVFQDNWSVFLKVLRDLEADVDRSSAERLGRIAELLIEALRIEPTLIHVIIQEVARSNRFVEPAKYAAFEDAFSVVRTIIEQGQKTGEMVGDFDARVASYLFFGGLETICTGFTVGAIPCGDDEAARRLKTSVRAVLLHGMLARET